jgi:hypothetical protein
MDCIGCGYCCRKGPCSFADSVAWNGKWDGCPYLRWNGERWRCSVYEDAMERRKSLIHKGLFIGEGCCSPLNTNRRFGIIPKPEENN